MTRYTVDHARDRSLIQRVLGFFRRRPRPAIVRCAACGCPMDPHVMEPKAARAQRRYLRGGMEVCQGQFRFYLDPPPDDRYVLLCMRFVVTSH